MCNYVPMRRTYKIVPCISRTPLRANKPLQTFRFWFVDEYFGAILVVSISYNVFDTLIDFAWRVIMLENYAKR